MTNIPESLSTTQRSFPRGTFRQALDQVRVENLRGFAGRHFLDRANELVKPYIPDLPPHLIELSWKIAILRDHVLTLDADAIEDVALEQLANEGLVESLLNPEVIAQLKTHDGMKRAVDLLLEMFRDQ